MLKELKTEIWKLKDPNKAKVLQRFFKTGKGEYGEGDIFLGITVPKLRHLVNKFWQKLHLTDIGKLLKSKYHEERLIALLILVRQFEFLNFKTKIFKFYLSHTKFINNWDLVDLSAPNIIGEYLINKNPKILFKLAKSKNLWEKRISILATFAFIKQGNSQQTLKLAKILLKDKHDLIHKAVGWMLREVGKKCGEKHLLTFFNLHAKKMPRTMLRYAIEKLPTKKRKYYLNK